jgi:hypothetical protein
LYKPHAASHPVDYMLDKMGLGKGTPVKASGNPITRDMARGWTSNRQSSRFTRHPASVTPSPEFSHSPHLCGWGPMGWPRASLVFRLRLLVPHTVRSTPAHFYPFMAFKSNIKITYLVQCDPDPATVPCSADRGGARTQIGRSPPASPVAWSAWIRQISRTQSTPRARSVARSRLYALRCIGDSKDSHLSRLSLVCCALLCLHSHTLVHS